MKAKKHFRFFFLTEGQCTVATSVRRVEILCVFTKHTAGDKVERQRVTCYIKRENV